MRYRVNFLFSSLIGPLRTLSGMKGGLGSKGGPPAFIIVQGVQLAIMKMLNHGEKGQQRMASEKNPYEKL